MHWEIYQYLYDQVSERFDQSTLITFFTKITYIVTSYKFYSQYIQYEEIGLLYIGFLPNSFLFTQKSKIVSIILSLLKLEHSSSPQRPRVQRPALQTTNIDQRPPPPAVRLHRHHTKRHHEVAHWKRASQCPATADPEKCNLSYFS